MEDKINAEDAKVSQRTQSVVQQLRGRSELGRSESLARYARQFYAELEQQLTTQLAASLRPPRVLCDLRVEKGRG